MELLKNYLTLLNFLVVIGAFLGSIKACLFMDAKDKFYAKVVNVMIGMYCGITIGHHFSTELNYYLTGLIAFVAGASGTIAIEVFLNILPNSLSSLIERKMKDL